MRCTTAAGCFIWLCGILLRCDAADASAHAASRPHRFQRRNCCGAGAGATATCRRRQRCCLAAPALWVPRERHRAHTPFTENEDRDRNLWRAAEPPLFFPPRAAPVCITGAGWMHNNYQAARMPRRYSRGGGGEMGRTSRAWLKGEPQGTAVEWNYLDDFGGGRAELARHASGIFTR